MLYPHPAAPGRFAALLAAQNHALQLALDGAALPELFDVPVRAAELQADHRFLASILLVDEDGRRLRHGAAPSLPHAYNQAIDGVPVGPRVGSCGTAAHLGHAIVVTDIARDALWADFKDLALEHGLRACWSTPFVGKDGAVLDTLALYYGEPRGPTEEEREIVEIVGSTAALTMENARLHGRVRDLNERASLAADAGALGFFTWEVGPDMVSWQNDRPYEIFGISPAEVPITAQRLVDEFLHPEDRQAFAEAVAEVLEAAAAFHFEGGILRRPDGQLRRVQFTGRLDAAARTRGVVRVVGIAADVTHSSSARSDAAPA